MKKKQQIPVIILKTPTGFSAHSPLVDGCISTGKSIDRTLKTFKEAIEFHLEGESLVKNKRKKPQTFLKEAFADYGTEAFYATVEVVAA